MSMNININGYARLWPVGLAALGLSVQASGQTSSTAPAEAELEEVTITGSRVVRDGFEAPTPVTVLTAETLNQTAPPTISDALRQLPSLMVSANPRANPQVGTADSNASAGSYLSLRNLGNVRMLMLMDGVRIPPNRSDGLTDSNLLPQMLVQRVEVVTGGASAAYGSDAVSGVINYIIDKEFKGLKFNVQGAASGYGDDVSGKLGIAGGTSFLDDRLHLVGSAEYYHNLGIDSVCDRQYGCDYINNGGSNGTAVGAGTAANPWTNYSQTRFNGTSFNGFVNTGPAAILRRDMLFVPGTGAVAVPFNGGTNISAGGCINCDGATHRAERFNMTPEVETEQFYGRATFDLTPGIRLWGQGTHATSNTSEIISTEFYLGNITIFSGNAYLSPAVQAAFTPTQQSFTLSKIVADFPNMDNHSLSTTTNWAAGAEFTINDKWSANVSATHGESSLKVRGTQSLNAEFYAAIDAVRDSAGNIVCRVTTTNPGLYPGCVPLNIFGQGNISQAAIDYTRGTYHFKQATELSSANASIAGDPFSIWAGPVSVVLGAEYRKHSLNVSSDAAPGSYITTGVRYGNGSNLRFRSNNVQPTSGSYSVKELFAEAVVPLLRDVPLVSNLDLNLAGRRTEYSTSGGVNTWKAGLTWKVSDDLRFRATKSRDIRAPTLNDLFLPPTVTTSGYTDLHTFNPDGTNVFGVVQVVTQGNTALQPEKADTITAGVVYSPSWVPGLRMSVDLYKIDINDALAQPFNLAQIGQQCEASGGTSPICSQIVRPLPYSNTTPANFPTQMFQRQINVSNIQVRGMDIELANSNNLFGGTLRERVVATYQSNFKTQAFAGAPYIQTAGYNNTPKLQLMAQISYDRDPISTFLQARRIGSVNKAGSDQAELTNRYLVQNYPVMYYFDAGLTWDLMGAGAKKSQVYFNISNLFDKQPVIVAQQQGNPGFAYPTNRQLYDVIGRSFTTGLRLQF